MSNKKILVIDDDLANVKMLAAMLKLDGYASEQFTDPTQAWQMLASSPEQYCLILADRVMPHLDALQLLQNLKNLPATCAIPFVVITGLAETDEKIDLLRAGAFDILFKPLERPLLQAVVKRALA